MRNAIRALLAVTLFCLTVSSAQAETVTVNGTVVSSVDPNQSTFTASPTELPADGIATSTLIVTARNSSGAALPNKLVTITSSRGNLDQISCQISSEILQQNTGTTDSSGQLICYVSSTTAGTSIFTAVIDTVTLTSQPQVIFTGSDTPTTGTTTTTTPTTKKPTTTKPSTETPTPTVETEKPSPAIPKTIPEVIELITDMPATVIWILIGIAVAILLLTGFPALPFLWLWLPWHRARSWGVVAEIASEQPIPGIWVELCELTSGRVLKKTITNRAGQYGFKVADHGQYWLQIHEKHYQNYRSAIIDLNQLKLEEISFDIKLTPLEPAPVENLGSSTGFTRLKILANLFQIALLIVGTFFSFLLLFQARSVTTWFLASLYTLLWLLYLLCEGRRAHDRELLESTQAGQLLAA